MEKAYIPFKKNYGYGWIIDSIEKRKMVYHSGNIAGLSSILAHIPVDDLCIVLLNNQEGTELETIARKTLDILYGKPYEIPMKKMAIVLPDDVLQLYIGTYEIADIHLTVEITFINHQLVAQCRKRPDLSADTRK